MRTRTTRTTRRTALTVLATLALALAGCSPGTDATDEPATTAPEVGGDLVVLAAASLQDTFTTLGAVLEEQHPGLTVTFSFGASSALAQQVLAGAPADVLATASTGTMADAADRTGEPEVFTHNVLEIAVPAGNPGDVTGLVDLADPGRTIALCAPEVPCGAAAVTAFEAAGLTPAPDTYEKDVTATLTKVVLGEVDAALVYATDVLSAGDQVEGIPFPEAAQAVNDYPVAVLTEAANPAAAQAFVTLLLSDAGQRVLAEAGFGAA